MRQQGVHADLSGVLLDAIGAPVTTPLSKRIIAINARQLHQIPMVIGIAYGVSKVPAIRAALTGDYLQALVTNTTVAEHLLAR
jgi:DNA-binding transcriptional regulator LsrR (DeoR family)